MEEKVSIVGMFKGQGVLGMQGWEAVLSLTLSGAALILLILTMVKFKENKAMRLAFFCLLIASSGFRLVRKLMIGTSPTWLEVAALVFFGFLAVSEAVQLSRERSRRRN